MSERRAQVCDDRVDQIACFCRLALDFGALGVIKLLARVIRGFIRWLLHLRNDHATEREPAFERKHGNPRQMRVSGNISCRELVSRWTTCPTMTIDKTDVATIRIINPTAIDTIRLRIDCLIINPENFTKP